MVGLQVGVRATRPGWADTPGVLDSLPLFHRLTGPLLRDAEGGADTTVWSHLEDIGQFGEVVSQMSEAGRAFLPLPLKRPRKLRVWDARALVSSAQAHCGQWRTKAL